MLILIKLYYARLELFLNMNKEEFLKKMKYALDGQVSDLIISDNIDYYKNYIDSEITNGKSEIEVLDMLGDPRLLAKTIIELQGIDNNENNAKSENDMNNDYFHDSYNKEDVNFSKGAYNSKHNSFLGIRGCLTSIVVLFIVFIILRFILSTAIYFALPICIIILLVGLFKRFR